MKNLLALLLTFCLLSSAFADTWVTRRGKTIKGSFLSGNTKTVKISTEGEEVSYTWDKFKSKDKKDLQIKTLFYAAEEGKLKTLKAANKWNINLLTLRNDEKENLLHFAVQDWDNYDTIKYLSKKKISANKKNSDKLTPYDLLLLKFHNWKIDNPGSYKENDDYAKYKNIRRLLKKSKAKKSSQCKKLFAKSDKKTKIVFGKINKALEPYVKDEIANSDGKKINKASLSGKYVAFYFSAHWCGPCRAFTPKLVKFRNANKDKFEVIFVSSDTSPASMKSYMEGSGMKWPAVKHKGKDRAFLGKKFSVSGIPKLVVINPKGEIVSTNGRGDLSGGRTDIPTSWKK